MLYKIAADFVFLLHFAFICFVVLGGLLTLRWTWLGIVHLPAAVWGALIEFLAWECPLTSIENNLRHAAGEEGFSGGFIVHYLLPVIYPEGLTPKLQFAMGTLVIVVNLVIYGSVIFRILGKNRKNTPPKQTFLSL